MIESLSKQILIGKAQLAIKGGVSKPAISKLTREEGALFEALVGKKINENHPLVTAWLRGKGVYGESDPLTAEVIAIKTGISKTSNLAQTLPKQPSYDNVSHQLQDHMETNHPDLQNLTLKEIVKRYGTMQGLNQYASTLKIIIDCDHRELQVKQIRGELIEKKMVKGHVYALIDLAFSRLVSDVPDALATLIIARIESGGDNILQDVIKIIHDANSKILKNLKTAVTKKEILK